MRDLRHRIHPRLSDILAQLDGTPAGDDLNARLTRLTNTAKPTPKDEALRAALHSHLWLLDRAVPDGLTLTQAGYLKPADVKALAEVLPTMHDWPVSVGREVDATPLSRFRHHLREVGLLRKTKGKLHVTKTGRDALADPEKLWSLLAESLVPHRRDFDEMAGLLILLHAATTSARVDVDAIARILTELGWSRAGGQPVDGQAVQWLWNDIWATLGNVGSTPTGPPVRTLLRRSLTPAAVSLVRDALLTPSLGSSGAFGALTPPAGVRVVHKPGLADELMKEVAPLLAAEGIDLDNPDTFNIDTLNAALGRAVERRNFELSVATGPSLSYAHTVLRIVTEALADPEGRALAEALVWSIEPQPVDAAKASVSQLIGVSTGLADTWHTDPSLARALASVRLPGWGSRGRAAGADVLALARKGRAFDSIGSLIRRHAGLALLEGSVLVVAASLIAWAAAEGREISELAGEVLATRD